jgi:hypothetical protein
VQVFLDRWFTPNTTRATVRERDRIPLASGGQRLTVEVLVEAGRVARLATWRLDIVPGAAGWRISGITTLSVVDGLYRLELDGTRQYRAKNLVVRAEDLDLHLPDGSVFVAQLPSGATAAVLIGRGEMVFTPAPETERRQIRLLTGTDQLRQSFDAAFFRMSPFDADQRLPAAQLTPVPVNARDLERARQVFEDEIGKSFSVDLADLSRETWSLLPSTGDFLAEVRTRHMGTLTYAHASNDPEDITVFDRVRRRNISIYASKARLASRGRTFDEDDSAEYDVLDYNVENSFVPDRLWMEGVTRLKIRIRAYALSAINIRLSDRLVVRSVTSDRHGRLLFIRVRNQNSLIVNLPEPVSRDEELTMTVTYAGRLEPQGVDRENLALDQTTPSVAEASMVEPEPQYVYSNRSYWYAQAPSGDYATATIRFIVPSTYGAVCSGEPASGSPVILSTGENRGRKLYVVTATVPLRYLACVVSRFGPVEQRDVLLPASQVSASGTAVLPLRVTSTVRVRGRANEVLGRAADVMSFYSGLVGDVPYPSLSIAVLESNIPGGHAPGYVAAINQPLPTSPFVWRDDPASFDDFPEFFIAHELAHQWWGQAVGWANYHEQWLSEGFAQYFSALFARQRRGPLSFAAIVRQFARWTQMRSDQGPVYLGYRLGHLRGEGRVFRALVYNKGAIVLDMLRRMLGEKTFLSGLRRYYQAFKFRKASTEDLRGALEAESGRSLEQFFNDWIYGQDLPAVSLSWSLSSSGDTVQVTITQAGDAPSEFPLTVTRLYADGTSDDTLALVARKVTTLQLPVSKRLRSVELNRDGFTPLAGNRRSR